MNQKISFSKALLIILSSVFLISGSSGAALYFYHYVKVKKMRDEKFNIVAIAQTSSDSESLKTLYLSELLNLSIDRPSNLYRFNTKEAKKKLLASSLIKAAHVKKIPPGTIFVEYTLRKPIAFLGDYTNTAIDADGVLFPFKPFFSPKNLPEIYLGLSSLGEEGEASNEEGGKWGSPLYGLKAKLALTIYQLITKYSCSENMQLMRIDTSKAFALSYGQRHIVVMLEERLEREIGGHSVLVFYPKILRLSTDNFSQEIANFLTLNPILNKKALKTPWEDSKAIHKMPATVIDLRVPHVAYTRI